MEIMRMEDIKKQIVLLHHAIVELPHQERVESIRFLADCCEDLRLTFAPYEDLEGGQVLNLTTSQKLQDYVPFFGRTDFEAQFLSRDFNEDHFEEPLDLGSDVLQDDPPEYQTLVGQSNDKTKRWETVETPNPVNLVVKTKEINKKSRRKQMFTKKSVRRLSERSKDVKPKELVRCCGCSTTCQSRSQLIDHLKSHESAGLCCRLCHSLFNELYAFWRHKEDEKCRARSKLICPDCGDKFKFENHFMKHLHGHKENNCKHCDEKLSSRAQSRDHMKRCHPQIKVEKEVIPCKFCPMSFPRLSRLYNHYKLHHSKGKFVCTSCGMFISTKEKHKEHMIVHENEKKYQCYVCKRKFYSKNMLTNHVKVHESRLYECLTCNITVASKAELLVHERNKHIVKGLEPKFKCDTCQKMFPKKSALERHRTTHSEKPLFNCKHCLKTFKSLGCLLKHEKRKTHFKTANVIVPESKYEKVYEDQLICENCGKQYQTYTQLKYHLRTHKSIFKCEQCEKTFNLKVNLRRHLRLHEGKGTAICELCGDSFSRLCSLKEHVAIKHSDLRPVQCSICSKSFKRKSELTRHKRIHESPRPYICFCGLDYKQAAHLKSHQKNAHGKGLVETPDILADSLEFGLKREKLGTLATLGPDILDRERTDGYVTNEHGTLLSLDNFEEQDYRLHDTFKVPYVPEDYGEHMGYGDLQFGAPTAVSPAVDLSMVAISDVVCRDMGAGAISDVVCRDMGAGAISDVVCRDMGAGLSKVEEKAQTEPSSTIQLVNLSEHIVQEYLLNLP